jgi:archaeal flagellar protein FlaJ
MLLPRAYGEKTSILFILGAIIIFGVIQGWFWTNLILKVEQRTKRVEDVLPDVLRLLSANIRAGMTPYKALRLASRKEFAPLDVEIHKATAQSLGTQSFTHALRQISKNIDSDILERSLTLFTTAMRSGGHLATLLEELAQDIEDTRGLKKELITSTKTYMSFIFFSIIILAPVLLSISIQFLDFMEKFQSRTGPIDSTAGIGLLAGGLPISADFMFTISVGMLFLTSILASILIGTIKEGKLISGLRYAPGIVVATMILFFILRRLISDFFSTLI